MRIVSIAVAWSLSACALEWNGEQPGIALTGDPPLLTSLAKLNTLPAGLATRMQAPDGATWAAFCEFRSTGIPGVSRGCKREHLARVSPAASPGDPGTDEVLEADDFLLRFRALYLTSNDDQAMTRTLTLHRPGEPALDDVAFVLPAGRAILYINDGGDDDVFVYWVLDKATSHFDVFRRDRRYQRRFAIPTGVDPANPGANYDFLLTSDGGTLVARDPDGTMRAFSTLDESAVPLGKRPPFFAIDNGRGTVITAGDDGLRTVSLTDATEHVLVPGTFDPSSLAFTSTDAYYMNGGDLYRVPLDGSAPPVLAQKDAVRLRGIGPNGEIVYSHDPASRYAGGAGDGWIGDWQFMERGRGLRFSGDGQRVMFLEHAATVGVVGELMSTPLPSAGGGSPLSLGLNVHSYTELPDGRLLSIENHVQAGTWNRLVVIDQEAMTKHWVVPSAAEFFLSLDNDQIVADVVTSATAYDIVRVPVPPKSTP